MKIVRFALYCSLLLLITQSHVTSLVGGESDQQTVETALDESNSWAFAAPRDRFTDEVYSVEGEQIVRIGKPPFRIANTQLTLTVRNSGLTEAIVLDINGYTVTHIVISDGRVQLPEDAMYVVLKSAQ